MNASELRILSKDIVTCDLEKDDDLNYKIDFIHATANLRARNFRIRECTYLKTKMTIFNITPSIVTTAAMISGCVTAEIFKFVQGFNNIEDYKNAFTNLAYPFVLFSEPVEVKKIKSKEFDAILCSPVVAIPEGHTTYDKIKIEGPLTFQQLFDKMKDDYGINVTLVSSG